MIDGFDDFLSIVKNFHDKEMRLGFVLGRFDFFKNGFIEIGEVKNERSVGFNKDFIIDLIDAFDDLEVVLDSLVEGQNHHWGFLVAFDGSNKSFYFVHCLCEGKDIFL